MTGVPPTHPIVTFRPYRSAAFELAVWEQISSLKLNDWGIENPPVWVLGRYGSPDAAHPSDLHFPENALIPFSYQASDSSDKNHNVESELEEARSLIPTVLSKIRRYGAVPIIGKLVNFNDRPLWEDTDVAKNATVQLAKELMRQIVHAADILHSPAVTGVTAPDNSTGTAVTSACSEVSEWTGCSKVLILSFVDLKYYNISYRVAIPVLRPTHPFTFEPVSIINLNPSPIESENPRHGGNCAMNDANGNDTRRAGAENNDRWAYAIPASSVVTTEDLASIKNAIFSHTRDDTQAHSLPRSQWNTSSHSLDGEVNSLHHNSVALLGACIAVLSESAVEEIHCGGSGRGGVSEEKRNEKFLNADDIDNRDETEIAEAEFDTPDGEEKKKKSMRSLEKIVPIFTHEGGDILRSESYRYPNGSLRYVLAFNDAESPMASSPHSSEVTSPLLWPLRNILFSVAVAHRLDSPCVPLLCLRESVSPHTKPQDGVAHHSHPLPTKDHSVVSVIRFPSLSSFPRSVNELNLKDHLALGFLYRDVSAPSTNANNVAPQLRTSTTSFNLNLKNHSDPSVIYTSSIDLNVKLIAWRTFPSFKAERLFNLKLLIVGAGTLGCAVARVAIGWGVKEITFVDNGRVSFSNPARQWLYTREDAMMEGNDERTDESEGNTGVNTGTALLSRNGPGDWKALAAARRIREIHPAAKVKGVVMDIGMVGHSRFTCDEVKRGEVRRDHERLVEVIQEHDVVMLLLDSREGRWLPSLICSHLNYSYLNHKGRLSSSRPSPTSPSLSPPPKPPPLCISSALGFDEFVVIRHAHLTNELGCYFCNDLAAPTNSTERRALDEQCTVTRPGLSGLAGGVSCELMASLTQHRDGFSAKAEGDSEEEDQEEEEREGREGREGREENRQSFGRVPHVVRGDLSKFEMRCSVTKKSPNCICCSEKIWREYTMGGETQEVRGEELKTERKENTESEVSEVKKKPLVSDAMHAFVVRAIDEPWRLSEVSGLNEVKRQWKEREVSEGRGVAGVTETDADDDEEFQMV